MESETERKRRTNARGHIHRSTLRASLARLEGAGIFTSWKTNGRLVGRLRMPAVRVWRLNRTAWARAWATLKHTLRRKMYTVRAEAYSTKKRKSGGDFGPPPLGRKVPVWLKDNDAGKRRFILEAEKRDRDEGRAPRLPSELRHWAVNRLRIEGVEWLFGPRAGIEYESYLARGGLAADYEASLARAGL